MGVPVPEPDLLKWGRWFETGDRRVAQTQVGPVWVSTVFLGLDHGFGRSRQPVLYETMTFDGEHAADLPLAMDRYSTRSEAILGHNRIVQELEAGLTLADIELRRTIE